MGFTKKFVNVPWTEDYYANWAAGVCGLPKTSLALVIKDDSGKVVWNNKYHKTRYNTRADMKRWLLSDAKAAGF